MNEYKYTEEIVDDDERVPEVRQNQVSEKLVFGVSIGIVLWILIFMILKTTGLISGLVMRICIYPVVVGIILFYGYVTYKNRGI